MRDDERATYLSTEDHGAGLSDAERAELDAVRALLSDASLWAEPPAGLEDDVVAAVAAGAASAGRRDERHRARRRGAAWLVAVAALVVTVLVAPWRGPADPALAATLAGTSLAPGASGHATFASTTGGWRIELDATGLPRLDHGRYYQAWLRDADGHLVPVGTFNEPDDVVLWAGVSPRQFSTITVTEASVADPSPDSPRRVLAGSIVER